MVVVNDTRVVPARLRLQRASGGAAEVLLLERTGEDGVWEALARPSGRLRAGERLGPVELLEPRGEGRWRVRLLSLAYLFGAEYAVVLAIMNTYWPNNAFESGRADKQRALGWLPRRRAAQRER